MFIKRNALFALVGAGLIAGCLTGCDGFTSETKVAMVAYQAIQNDDLRTFEKTLMPESDASRSFRGKEGMAAIRAKFQGYEMLFLESSTLIHTEVLDPNAKVSTYRVVVGGRISEGDYRFPVSMDVICDTVVSRPFACDRGRFRGNYDSDRDNCRDERYRYSGNNSGPYAVRGVPMGSTSIYSDCKISQIRFLD